MKNRNNKSNLSNQNKKPIYNRYNRYNKKKRDNDINCNSYNDFLIPILKHLLEVMNNLELIKMTI